MLAALTATAVNRGWPPTVYSRLVSQLYDSSDTPPSEQACELFSCLTAGSPPGPLQYEYMVILSSDPHSAVYFPILLSKFAHEIWSERLQSKKDLMSYLARAAPTNYVLTTDYDDMSTLASSISLLLDQAVEGCEESRVLALSLTYTNTFTLLTQSDPNWRTANEPKLKACRMKSAIDSYKSSSSSGSANASGNEVNSGDGDGSPAETTILSSSRSLRFLWLDWVLRAIQPLVNASLKKQLDLMWPGDRVPVVSYELCVTAFDVVAAPSSFPDATPAPALAPAFIVKKLPLILQQLALPETNEESTGLAKNNQQQQQQQQPKDDANSNSLDGVIARLFTTMDKEVIEAVEQRHPGLREEFGIACVEIGLCDPTVLHALHRSYTPQTQPDLPVSIIDFNFEQFPKFNPENQAHIAKEVTDSARGIHQPMGRHKLAELCIQLYKNPEIADQLFVHTSVRDFMESVCVNADSASLLMEEEGCSGLIYDDLGCLLGTAKMLTYRYNVTIPEVQAPWAAKYLKATLFPHVGQLSQAKQTLMGQWVVALFSKSSGGIADELFRSFGELSEVLPALLQQAVRAYQSAVIDRETLRNGLEHFANPYMATLMAPLVLRVLYTELFHTIHQSTTALECIVFFLSILVEKQSPKVEIAKSFVLPIAQQLLNVMNTLITGKNSPNIALNTNPGTMSSKTEAKLVSVLSSLVNKLNQQQQQQLPSIGQNWVPQLSNQLPAFPKDSQNESPSLYIKPTSSLAESARFTTAALLSWQLKPSGIPTVPTIIVSLKAKPILGAKVTRNLVESICLPQSQETAVAMFVADGLQSSTSLLIDADSANSATDIAREFLNQFNQILTEADQETLPSVVVPTVEAPSSSNGSAVKESGASVDSRGSSQKPDVSMASADPSPSVAPAGGDMDLVMSNMEDPESIQDINFDNDFTSQPMNLEDLDSAMDFGWE